MTTRCTRLLAAALIVVVAACSDAADDGASSPGETTAGSTVADDGAVTSTTTAPDDGVVEPATSAGDDYEAYASVIALSLFEFERETFDLPGVGGGSSLADAGLFFDGLGTALTNSADRIRSVDVPEPAAAAHAELVDRIDDFAGLNAEIAVEIGGFSDPSEIDTMASDPRFGVDSFNGTRGAMLDACDALQAIVQANSAEADVRCRSLEPVI
ncbi:MAG: hypothetical protein QNJ12_04540 [Ilumatobacter sp.]|uniref:hypothetical protein n=1 Tax=Ilumatobacter sp. TaxID=1967498 RepID=UPI0026280AE5|nr:hypothetical protein [Ilumatobacter sp.]MDJ0768034.1 hypothetical protein [Ilumatobacter sp.]